MFFKKNRKKDPPANKRDDSHKKKQSGKSNEQVPIPGKDAGLKKIVPEPDELFKSPYPCRYYAPSKSS